MALQFLGLGPPSCNAETARVVIIPVPYDGTTCCRTGTREGPFHILAASPHMELFDEEIDAEVWTQGIHTTLPLETLVAPDQMTDRVQAAVDEVYKAGRFPVVLGGEHSVTLGAVRAIRSFEQQLTVVQFDAHTDLRDTYLGSPYSHACVMRRLWPTCNIQQVGIRSISREESEFLNAEAARPIRACEVLFDRKLAVERLLQGLDDNPIYVTIDLDCLDPSIMPAVGTPEPGGLSWTDLLTFLRGLALTERVVGFDVVELSPIPGYFAADYTAARLVYKFLSYLLGPHGGESASR